MRRKTSARGRCEISRALENRFAEALSEPDIQEQIDRTIGPPSAGATARLIRLHVANGKTAEEGSEALAVGPSSVRFEPVTSASRRRRPDIQASAAPSAALPLLPHLSLERHG